MKDRLLVTMALPYANGSLHLGHLVEHIQTDVYVRFRRALGHGVTYVCAADSHGTPIEVNAGKAGMTPREFAEKYRADHVEDFRRFHVELDTYYTTDSEENRDWSWRIYRALRQRGLVYARAVEQLYCEVDARFLPDRFVKGTCPRCGTPDQYGDVCEKCGTTYDPRELGQPTCVLCGTAPVVRQSTHAYVDLKKVEPVIREWVEGEGHLEPAVREQVRGWLADLQDWCITRDAPYFGFPVPPEEKEFEGKFLYVWLDAPIGYLSSAAHYFAHLAPEGRRLGPAAFERAYLAEDGGAELQHFIGKDILRFHAVFWPAMLWSIGAKRPERLAVHGHLTVNGEKMSKSRGTFVTGKEYLASGLDPQLLRYFYCANLGPGVADLDLSLDEFRNRINADLANNVANLASRTYSLLQRSRGPLAAGEDPEIAGSARRALAEARHAYQALEYREVVRLANGLASLCNKRLQDARPWERPAADDARALLGSVAGALRAVSMLLHPILPIFAADLARSFGWAALPRWTEALDPFAGGPVTLGEKPPQIARLEAAQVARLVALPAESTPARVSAASSPAETASRATARPAAPGVIGYDDFAKVELRVGLVLAAEPVPKADKLLKLSVDVGEGGPRTIVAGIAQAYPDPAALVGQRIVVVANLEPRPLRGILSQGMLLAAGEPPLLRVVTVGDGIAPGTGVK